MSMGCRVRSRWLDRSEFAGSGRVPLGHVRSGEDFFLLVRERVPPHLTAVFADSTRARGTHRFKRTQSRPDDSHLGGIQPARLKKGVSGSKGKL